MKEQTREEKRPVKRYLLKKRLDEQRKRLSIEFDRNKLRENLPKQFGWRQAWSGRGGKGGHEVKFGSCSTNFTSWPASVDGIPMDFQFLILVASTQPHLMQHVPISWIRGLQGAAGGVMT